jgi:uncharacterized repeat protein (TIGR01451 family)
MTIARHVKNACLALIALSSVGALQSAFAVGTPAGTTINNQATVDYSVGGVPQNQLSAAVPFVVDRKVDLTVTEVSGNATLTTPGQNDVIATFRVTNNGNGSQGYQLSIVQDVGPGFVVFGHDDNLNVNNLRWFVDVNNNGTYDGPDNETNIGSLATDADGESRLVFVLADIPVGAGNNTYANVRLTAIAVATDGSTLTQSSALDDPNVEQIVFADAGRDRTESAADQYHVQSAALTITKTLQVISDPFNGGSNPKAIPGAVVQYRIRMINASTTTAATAVTVTDNIPANTTFVPGSIRLDAGIVTDANGFIAGPPARVVVDAGAVPPNNGTTDGQVDVTFQVTINN